MNIAVATNQNFLKYTYVMLTSLFENNKQVPVYVYILYRDIPASEQDAFMQLAQKYNQNIDFVYVSDEMIPSWFPHSDKWTIETWFRLICPFTMNCDRILYLDVDLIVNQPLSPLYDIDFNGKSFAACQDISSQRLSAIQGELFAEYDGCKTTYYNAGVMLINLKKIRKNYTLHAFWNVIAEKKDLLTAYDQDIVNYMFHDDILELDGEICNLFARSYFNNGIGYDQITHANVINIHFTGPKPWSPKNLRTDIEKLWWKYAKLTPYYYEMLEELLWGEMDYNYTNTSEFHYKELCLKQLEDENARLKQTNAQLLEIMEESRKLIEKLQTSV